MLKSTVIGKEFHTLMTLLKKIVSLEINSNYNVCCTVYMGGYTE